MPPIAPLPFRLSPLVLALCCVFTPPAMAAPDASPADAATMSRDTSVANEVATDADANASNDTDTLAQPWSNAPAGFMSRATLATDPTLKDRPIPAGCQGLWVTPIPASIRPDPHNDNVNILATADYGYYHPSAGSELSGQVRISQPNRLLEADHITLDATQTIAEASGHVRLSEIGLVSLSDRLRYNLKDQSGDMSSSQYISESLQAHGHAQQVSRTPEGVTHLTQAEYSTCEPDHRVWNLKARSIELNSQTGIGTARNTTLFIQDIPVIHLPWFIFPVDDRRLSGLLVPRGGYTNDGGLDLSLPYYFNLAPQYDLTLTPRLLSRRQSMLEGEFRLLTAHAGSGMITGGYLPNDPLYGNDRKRASLKYDWQLTPHIQSLLNLNYVSDKDYYTDLGTDPLVTNQLNQERALSFFYHDGLDGLTGLLRVQTFQTVDPDTADVDRPYDRLPQLLLNYQNGSALGWQYNVNHDTAYFKKSITDGSGVENSGLRVYNQLATRYNLRGSWGSFVPELSVRHLYDRYDQDTLNSQGLGKDNATRSTTVPQVTLDGKLVFERQGRFLQTLEPRLFYAYSPYRNQDTFPNFDSATASQSYSQLFSPYRFVGHDRLEDNNFASVGLTHRFYDDSGLEVLSTSVGQSFYFDHRRVRLDSTQAINSNNSSGIALDVSAQFTQHLRMDGTALWMPNGQNAQTLTQIQYQNNQGQLYQIGYVDRHEVTELSQKALRQLTASLVQPLYNQWRAFGYIQYDLDHHVNRDGLLGFDYDGCCWRMALYGRSYYNDLDETTESKPRRLVMAEFTLKGLAGLSGNLANLLRQKILGYTQVDTSWSSR
jgi:LPS-assembly protein